MATVVKSWTFDSDNEGLADAGTTTYMTFAWKSNDGHDANGCFELSDNAAEDYLEYARKAATTDTWETWGVPAGATITNVQLSFWGKVEKSGTSSSGAISIIASNGATIASLATIYNYAQTWTQIAPASASVGASYQASTTPVRLQFYAYNTNNQSIYTWWDDLALTITYTGGGGEAGAQIPAAISMEQKQRGHANLRR